MGILGTGPDAGTIGIMEVILLENAEPGVYSYSNKEQCEDRVHYRLPDDPQARMSAEVALNAYRTLGCRDAGRVDIKLDENGLPNFMEVNPLAGLHPEHSDLPILCRLSGITYSKLIEGIMVSALKRNGLPAPVQPSVYPLETARFLEEDIRRR